MSDVNNDLSFVLYHPFAAAHFDLRTYKKPRAKLNDARDVERAINILVGKATSRSAANAGHAAIAKATLLQFDQMTQEALTGVQAEADSINIRFLNDPLYTPFLPHNSRFDFALKWDDRRMWALVRGLIHVDVATRQLIYLMARGAFSFKTVKQYQAGLIRPWRQCVVTILTTMNALPNEVKRPDSLVTTTATSSATDPSLIAI